MKAPKHSHTNTKHFSLAQRCASGKPKHFLGYLLHNITQLNGKLRTHCSHSLALLHTTLHVNADTTPARTHTFQRFIATLTPTDLCAQYGVQHKVIPI